MKETEVGLVPENWAINNIGALFDVQQGKALSPRARGGQSPRPFLRTANVLWGSFNLNTLDEMDFTDEEFAKLDLHIGDLLVCEGGDIGRSAVWKKKNLEVAFQNHLHRLRVKVDKHDDVSSDFVMYWLWAAFVLLKLYGGVGNRTTIPNLSAARLKSLVVPLPPLPEQRAIAAVLAEVQAAIETQRRIVSTLKELKAATMAKLFREGTRGERLKQTDIGEMPESWEVVRLGEVISEAQYGLSVRGSASGHYPILRMNCQQEGRVVFRDLQYVDLDNTTLDHFRLSDGDVLFNRTNSIDLVGRTAIFQGQKEAVFASYLIRLRTIVPKLHPAFLNFYLNYGPTQQRLKGLATRAVGQSNISASKLKILEIPLPQFSEQKDISKYLSEIANTVEIAGKKEQLFQEVFHSLLHLLMIGRVRVTPQMIEEAGHVS